MSDLFAEATVKISPTLTGFKTDLEKDLKAIMAKVKVQPIRIKPALTRNFVGDLRKQVNAAILQAQKGVKPVVIRTIVETPSRRQLAALVQAPVSLPGRVGHIAPGIPAGAGVSHEQTLINRELARGIPLLGGVSEAQKKVEKSTRSSTAALKEKVSAESNADKSNRLLAESTELLATKEVKAATSGGLLRQEQKKLAISTAALEKVTEAAAIAPASDKRILAQLAAARKAQTDHLARVREIEAGGGRAAAVPVPQVNQRALAAEARSAQLAQESLARSAGASTLASVETTKVAKARTLAHEATAAATLAERSYEAALKGSIPLQQVGAFRVLELARARETAAKIDAKAAAEEARNTSRKARSSEQLTRGGQASLLSLAGIRGATLAASSSFLAGAAAITVFAKAVKDFADLETNLEVFRATASATAAEMEQVRKAAIELGADLTLPNVSAGDAAEAMVELAKAGLSVQDSIDGARGVLELATAAAIDNADATRLVANALNAFQLSGKDAIVVADTLANSANLAQGSIEDIGTAFQQAASAGRQVGLTFQDTSAFLTILAQNGLRGSDAGTSLRTALIRLVHPSAEAAKQLQNLGVQIRDTQGNVRPDVFIQIAEATANLTPAARDATLALIGGQDAFRAVSIFGRTTTAQLLKMREALRQEGTAADLAAARTKGLHGSVSALGSVLQTEATNIGAAIGPGLASLARGTATVITQMGESTTIANTLSQTLASLKIIIVSLGETVIKLAQPFIFAAGAILKFTNAIGATGPVIAAVAAYKLLGSTIKSVIALETVQAVIRGRAKVAATAVEAIPFAKKAGLGTGPVAAAAGASGAAAATSRLAIASTSAKSAIAGVVASLNPYAVAATVAAGAIFFFATRESNADKANKEFGSSIQDLTNKLNDVKVQVDSYQQSLRGIATLRLSLDQDKLALATARSALSSTKAAKATNAYKQLVTALAFARQDLKFSEEDYSKAVEESNIQLEIASQAEKNLQAAREESAASAAKLVAFEKIRGEGLLGVNLRVALSFKKQADAAREENTAESLFLAKRLDALSQISRNFGAPSANTIELLITTPNLTSALKGVADEFKKAGKEVPDDFVTAFLSELTGSGAQKIFNQFKSIFDGLNLVFAGPEKDAGRHGKKTMDNWMAAAAAAARAGEKKLEAALSEAVTKAFDKVNQLNVQEDLAVIASGATSATLPVEQQKLQAAISARQKAEALIAAKQAAGVTVGLATARKARAQAISDQRAATEAIRGINEQLVSDSKAAADKAKTQQDKIFDNILTAMGLKRDRRQRAIENAQASESLADDLATTRKLRQLAAAQIKNIQERIKAAKALGKNVQVLIDGLKDLRKIFSDLGQELVKLQQDRQQQLKDLLFERLDLKIQIAQSRDNVAAELRARRAKLEALTKELVRVRRAFGKNSIEWLRAKAAQVEEIASIKALEKSSKQKQDAQKSLFFTFLQTQEGFAANLLGNLIPGFATRGLVGNAATAAGGSGLRQVAGGFEQPRGGNGLRQVAGGFEQTRNAAAIASSRDRGVRPIQVDTTNHLLRQILRVLMGRPANPPEIQHNRQRATAAYDTLGAMGD